jgi:hypothetical protein
MFITVNIDHLLVCFPETKPKESMQAVGMWELESYHANKPQHPPEELAP